MRRSLSPAGRNALCASGIALLATTGVARDRPQAPAQPQADRLFTVTQLTTHGRVGASDLGPAVSPDGKLVAYIRFEQPGPQVQSEIWLLNRETGRETVLVPRARVEYWGIDFAPDGTSVYATQSLPPLVEGSLIRVRVADGLVEHVRAKAGREPAISPDGRSVAFNRNLADPPARELIVAPLGPGPERVLTRRLRPEALNYPSWRSDGKAILFRALDPGHGSLLMEVTLDGVERVIAKPDGWGNASTAAWLHDRSAFVVSANQGSALWRVSYPDGNLQRLGLSQPDAYGGFDGASSAPVMVGVRRRSATTLWMTMSADAATGEERPWTDSPAAPIWTADGKLLFSLGRGGTWSLVITEPDGREIRRSPIAVPSPGFPSLSRTGEVLLWNSYVAGDRAFWRSDAQGGNALKVTPGPSDYQGGSVAPDGTWFVYASWASGRFGVWKKPMAGGAAVLLIPEESMLPAISPDGQWVASIHRRTSTEPWRVVVVPAAGGEPVSLGALPLSGTGGPKWTRDGAISFTCAPAGVENICVVPRTGGAFRQLTTFTEGTAAAHAWSPDGRLLVLRSRVSVDLVLIDVARER